MKPAAQTWPEAFARRYRERGYWIGETFTEMLSAQVAKRPDAIAVVGGNQRWSYAELGARAERAAAGFNSLGLQPGERVVVQLPNCPDFLAVVFGLFRAGLVPVYALPAHRLAEVAHLVRKSEAAAYVTTDRHDGFDYRALARMVVAQSPDLRHVIVAGKSDEFVDFSTLGEGKPPAGPIETDPSAVAFMQISGGSTGLPKLIPRTHDDYLYSVRASAEICELSSESVYLAALPMAHNFPMSSPGFLGALSVGGRVVLSPSPSPDVAFPLIAQEGVTITGLVPPLALLWLQAAAGTQYDLSSLEVLQVGGAKFLSESARRVRPVLGCTLQQVFGMAEGLVNYTRLDDPEETIVTTQGRPISADDEILVVDDHGIPTVDGIPGHLLTRGPYTIRGYHDDPAANERSFTPDGYYRTGDIVRRLPGGYLEVMGRATDHINRAGEKISAEEVEEHLLAHPAVFDVVVVSLPDPYLGERICACIIPAGTAPRAAEIKSWMRGRDIAPFKIPDQVTFVPDFAVTAVGKISRKELRAELRDRLVDQERAGER